jgi:hypothetical protein
MEQNFQTSFIPKKPIIENRVATPRSAGILTVVSVLILFSVLLATIGLYFYKGILTRGNDSKVASLERAKNDFEPAKITELQLLDRRLRASSVILANHTTVTPIFQALQDLTMKTVRYTKFNYDIGSGKILIKISGMANGYGSVALQSDLYLQNQSIIDPVFSNLTLDATGNVLFDLDFSVNPSFVDYKQTLLTQK